MARGGRRQGRTGERYANRSDLQSGARLPIRSAPSQQYGERTRIEELQRALPSRRAVTPVAAPAPAAVAPVPPPPLDAPTEAPDEPVTAGSAFGPGPGPEALGIGQGGTYADELRALYHAFPNDDLRALIEVLDGR